MRNRKGIKTLLDTHPDRISIQVRFRFCLPFFSFPLNWDNKAARAATACDRTIAIVIGFKHEGFILCTAVFITAKNGCSGHKS